jgi:hypothetical protein
MLMLIPKVVTLIPNFFTLQHPMLCPEQRTLNSPANVDTFRFKGFLTGHHFSEKRIRLCREMVDDLRDLIVSGRRAAERQYRLEWIAANTYGFILAPSYVMAG